MSLIICPECGKEISDKSKICINCGYPIKNEHITNFICDINGKKFNLSKSLNLCISGKNKESFIEISNVTKMSIKNCLNLLEQINILESVPESYNIKEYKKEEEKQAASYIFQMKNDKTKQSTTKSCPKCGCTEFVPLRRKFSLLTGFATNKVDMVCKNCGTVVK